MQTVRVWFSKTGRAAYISHLDLNRAMSRAVRRAGIPLWYTEGFNRHPYVTFAAPLSLGYEGLRESMDIRLEEEMDMEELAGRLGKVMPEGLAVLSAAPAVEKPGELAAARYRLAFSCPAEPVRAMLDQESLPMEKRTKKKTLKIVDIRPALGEPVLEEENGQAVLTVTLPCGEETVNPALVLEAVRRQEGGGEAACAVRRLLLLDRQGKEFA